MPSFSTIKVTLLRGLAHKVFFGILSTSDPQIWNDVQKPHQRSNMSLLTRKVMTGSKLIFNFFPRVGYELVAPHIALEFNMTLTFSIEWHKYVGEILSLAPQFIAIKLGSWFWHALRDSIVAVVSPGSQSLQFHSFWYLLSSGKNYHHG